MVWQMFFVSNKNGARPKIYIVTPFTSGGFAQNGLGNLLLARGDIDDAIAQYFAADASWRALGGEQHPDRGYALHNLGKAYAMLGDAAQAREYYGQALQIRENGLGQRHHLYIHTRAHQAGVEKGSDHHSR